jgi:TonB family protein
MRMCLAGGVRLALCVLMLCLAPLGGAAQNPNPGSNQNQNRSQGAGLNTDLAAMLALPMSPGSIALLAERPTEPSAQQRIKEALADGHPEVRTVAARVILDMGMRGLLPDVQAALAHEQDPIAGAEELRAWMTLAPTPATYATCVEAAVRLGFPATTTVVDTFARLNASELITYIPRLWTEAGLGNAVFTVTETDHEARMRAAHALLPAPEVLDALLVAMHQAGDHPSSDLIVSLLQAKTARERVVGIWYVTLCLGTDGRVLSPEVKAALDPLIAASATQVTWESLGLELIARAEGRAARERRWLDLQKLDRPASGYHLGDEPLFKRLTSTELGDYYEATGHSRGDARTALASGIKRVQQAQTDPPPDAVSDARPSITPNVGVRTVPPFVAGLWTDLIQLTGCQPQPGLSIGADIAYRPDGRPLQIRTSDNHLSPACLRFARTLFSLTLAEEPRPRPATFSDVVVLALQADTLRCADRAVAEVVADTRLRWAQAAADDPNVAHATLHPSTRPKRTSYVKAMYTDEAYRRRIEGDVLVETTLTQEGCISQGAVVKSPSPLLSGPALFTILDWRFAPATLDGKPVSLSYRVTVQFGLQRR